MAKTKGPIPIPLNKNGDLITFSFLPFPEVKPDVAHNVDHYPFAWVNNYTFTDVLVFKEFRKGRSAVNALFSSISTDKCYPVFLTDLKDMMPFLQGGRVKGNFTFVKRGQNYGLKRVSEDQNALRN